MEVIKTELKGFGLRATDFIKNGSFIIEYVGEVIPQSMFLKRTREYSDNGATHFYFMSLCDNESRREVIDAQKKGNLARFMNHSCKPNCALEKWVVGSRLRIGIFSIKDVAPGEELTFDYKFERYGAQAQPCYCGEDNCKGVIGGDKQAELKDLDDEDDYDLEGVPSPKKRSAADTEKVKKPITGLESIEDVEKYVKTMLSSTRSTEKPSRVRRLLARLELTPVPLQRKFLQYHGLYLLKSCLKNYMNVNLPLCFHVLRIMKMLPIANRNSIVDAKMEDVVNQFIGAAEHEVSQYAKEELDTSANGKRPIDDVYGRKAKSPDDRDDKRRKVDEDWSSSHSLDRRSSSTSSSYLMERQRSFNDRTDDHASSSHDYTNKSDTDSRRTSFYESRVSYSRRQSETPNLSSLTPKSEEAAYASPLSASNVSTTKVADASESQSQTSQTNGQHVSANGTSSNSWQPKPVEEDPMSRLPPEAQNLPPNWKASFTEDRRVYYYNTVTRQTQWEPPTVADLGASIVDGITEVELQAIVEQANAAMAQRKKDGTSKGENVPTVKIELIKNLRNEVSQVVLKTLSKYKNLMDTDRFKRLARKITHQVLEKESRSNILSATLSEDTKHKIKKYVKTTLVQHKIIKDNKSGSGGDEHRDKEKTKESERSPSKKASHSDRQHHRHRSSHHNSSRSPPRAGATTSSPEKSR
ncbi:histone methyltransferase set2 [Quaeritorhiza haematococci]|nr:histone methyltransferase set2 [Quaeritorhiza haematococci]